MSQDSELHLTVRILIDGLLESYQRMLNGLSGDTMYAFVYLDIMAFLSCAQQIGEVLESTSVSSDIKNSTVSLKHHVKEARNYYQHIAGRIKESLAKGDIILGSISWSKPRVSGEVQLGGTAILSGGAEQIIPIPAASLLGKPEPTITLDLKTKSTHHHIDFTTIKNEVIELKAKL